MPTATAAFSFPSLSRDLNRWFGPSYQEIRTKASGLMLDRMQNPNPTDAQLEEETRVFKVLNRKTPSTTPWLKNAFELQGYSHDLDKELDKCEENVERFVGRFLVAPEDHKNNSRPLLARVSELTQEAEKNKAASIGLLLASKQDLADSGRYAKLRERIVEIYLASESQIARAMELGHRISPENLKALKDHLDEETAAELKGKSRLEPMKNFLSGALSKLKSNPEVTLLCAAALVGIVSWKLYV